MERDMREVGSFEAKNKLSALLDQVEHGMEIVITLIKCRLDQNIKHIMSGHERLHET
jgi:hypothetical protein